MQKPVWIAEHRAVVGHVQTGETSALALTIETNDSGAFAILTAFARLPDGGWQPRSRVWIPVERCGDVAAAIGRAAGE